MNLLKQLLFFILLLVTGSLFSQEITFNQVISPLGGFSGFVGGIAQDKNGYMWFASTGGLFKYDGYHFKTYTHDPADSNSLSATHLETVYADSKGILWVATWVNGLDRLDPATGKFTHFKHDPNDPGSLSDDYVRTILEDHEGVLWIGTHGGLDKYDPRTGKFQHYRNDPNDTNSLSCDRVRIVYEDRKGTLWIGTGSVFEQEGGRTDEGGLNRFDKKTGKFKRYIYNPKDPHSLINNKVNAIFEDSKGNFWVGTAGDGLHTMDRSAGKFERYLYDPSHPERLSRPSLDKNNIDNITFIREDAVQNIWIGTLANGLNRYDPKTQKTTHYGAKENLGGFTGFSAWCYCNSTDGNFWVGTFEGALYRVDPYRKTMPHVLTIHSVFAFNSDSDKDLWVGTANGLIFRDRDRSTRAFLRNNNDTSSLSNSVIYSLCRDAEGTLWVGTNNGLNRFNASAKNFTRYVNDPDRLNSIAAGGIHVITEAGKDSLWIGTENGLDLMNKSDGTFTHFRNNPKDSSSLGANLISALLRESSGDLWVGLYQLNGLDLFDHKTGRFKHFLKNRNITSLVRDDSGTLWVGADDGLYQADKATDNFIRFYDPGSGTIISGVFSIEKDNQGKLWVGTPSGIFSFDPVGKQTILYGSNYGVDGGSLTFLASYKGNDGRIYFGDLMGYYSFSPEEIVGNSSAPRIILTGLTIRGQAVMPGQDAISDTSIEGTNKISLRYYQNVFSFEFAGIHYSSPEYNRHLYMLENYDQAWHEAGADKTASYYNIPPGHYTFRIRAASSDGIWAEKAVDVIISPPWWRTWWAYCIYGLLFIVLAYSVHRYQKAQVIKAERERTRARELAQAKEIEKAYHELKTTQSQLVQQEKMASLGELTAGIAHEIQNPLNFVNNFSEINSELVDELKTELAAGNIQSAIEAAENIKSNQEKVKYHGKRADAIVKSMLQHSRTSSGQKELTDINALCDEYLRLAYHGLRAKDKSFNAKFETHLDPAVGKINIVPQEIGRVMLNLINNAFYAVDEKKKTPQPPKGGDQYEPTVTVSTKKNNDKLQIKVSDNGNGIPKKIADKIFQPFFTTKPTGQGTGLGLSLAYDIVKAHGGEIKVETKEGEGSEFIISLPM